MVICRDVKQRAAESVALLVMADQAEKEVCAKDKLLAAQRLPAWPRRAAIAKLVEDCQVSAALCSSFSVHAFLPSFTPSSFMPSFIHAFTHSFIHSCTHSFIHSLTHAFIQSFIHPFIHSLIHSFIHSLIYSFIISSMQTSTHALTHACTPSFRPS